MSDAFGTPQPQGPTNGNAITALILGIAGIFILPVLLSIPAIVFARKAKREIDARGEGGRGLATAGLVLGWIGTVLGLLFVVGLVVFGVFAVDQLDTAP